MIMRRAALISLALVLTACSTVVDGTGQGASGVRSSGGPVPCGSTGASQAPHCLPPTSSSGRPTPTTASPTPTRSSASPTTSPTGTSGNAVPARWSRFARTVYDTPLGDPAVLNVCKVAGSTSLAKYGLALIPPSSTLGGSCSLDFRGAKVKDRPSVVFSVSRSGPDASPKPQRTRVAGQVVYAFPYDRTGSCLRQLVVTGKGVTTTVSVRLYGPLPGGRATSCGVSNTLIAPFALIAAGRATAPTIPVNSPSLFALDACKVAGAAKISSARLAAGNSADPTDYDTSCSWIGSSALFVSTGLLRTASAKPAGRATTVGRHVVYDTADVRGTCNYTSKQAGGETVEIYYSQAKAASASQCRQAAVLLGRYLDVLGLR